MELNHTSEKNILRDSNVYIIISLTLIPIMGELTIAPILPDVAKLFNVSSKEVQLVITIFFLPVIIATPIFGVLADRMGIKKLLVPSLLLFAVAGGYTAFAHDFKTLLWWRFIQGLGATSLNFMALTIISMIYRGNALTTVMSLNVGIIGISTTIFPIIGGVLGGFSWRYPFLLAVSAFPLLMLVLMVLKLPQKASGSQNINLKIYLQDTWHIINNPRVLQLLLTLGSVFAIQAGAFIIYIPILAGVNLGASGFINGLILSSMSVSVTVVALQLERLTRRISEITLIKIAFMIISIALIMIPTIHNAWLLIIPCLLFGVAEALAITSSQALLAELVTENVRSGFMAVNATVQSIAQVAGPVSAGIFFSLWGMQGVFWATAGISLATLALFNFLQSALKDKKISREV